MNHIKAVVFDWAGTLVDYGSVAPAAVFNDVLGEFGIELTLDEIRAPMGLEKKEHVRALFRLPKVAQLWQSYTQSPPDEQAIEWVYSKLNRALRQTVQRYSTAIPGIDEVFRFLRESNVKIGSSTGYSGEIMEVVIPRAIEQGILPDVVVTPETVPAGRPAPFMMYRNALLLETYPMCQMVKIGDTVADIEEGRAAGMWTIGMTACGNEVGLSEEEFLNTDARILNERISKAEMKLRAAGAHYTCRVPAEIIPLLLEINLRIQAGEKPDC